MTRLAIALGLIALLWSADSAIASGGGAAVPSAVAEGGGASSAGVSAPPRPPQTGTPPAAAAAPEPPRAGAAQEEVEPPVREPAPGVPADEDEEVGVVVPLPPRVDDDPEPPAGDGAPALERLSASLPRTGFEAALLALLGGCMAVAGHAARSLLRARH